MMTANAATTVIASRSPVLTPSMFPNKAASKLLVNVLKRLMRAIPNAKLAVVIIPIAASVPILRLRVVRVINRADKNPQMLAPIKKLNDIT